MVIPRKKNISLIIRSELNSALRVCLLEKLVLTVNDENNQHTIGNFVSNKSRF